jgi:hypothetical protein
MQQQHQGGSGPERGGHKGMHLPGRHWVMERGGLKMGERTDRTGREFPTLTSARRGAKAGDVIVRCADGVVVSVR